MALHVEDHGTGNWLEAAPGDRAALHGTVVFTGTGARVAIGPGCQSTGLRIEAGTGAAVTVGGGGHLGALFVHAAAGARAELGAGLGVNGLVRLLLHEPGLISIGDGGLIGAEVDISNSDMHAILDLQTGARVNGPRDVVIGPRVWLGQRAMVLKGSTVGHDTVIGAGAVVAGAIPAHCVAAGNPARVVRTGVRWRMDL